MCRKHRDDGCGCAEEKLLSFDKKKRKKGGKRQTQGGVEDKKRRKHTFCMAHAFFIIIIRESFVFKVLVQKGIIIKISLFC